MAQTQAAFDVAKRQQAATAAFASTLYPAAESLLEAQAAMLLGFEHSFTEWLHRRHEAIIDTQRLFARLRQSSDPAEALQAQQDWALGVCRRLAADAEGAAQAALVFLRAAAPPESRHDGAAAMDSRRAAAD